MEFLLVLFLILLNGVFAMSEMALVSAKKARLQQMAEKGSIGALKAIALADKPSYFISTVQVGITSIGILNGIVGEKSLVEPFSNFLIGLSMEAGTAKTVASVGIIVMLTYLSVVFGEIIPKRIGLLLSEKVAATTSIPMSWLSKMTFPVIWLFSKSSEIILKVLRLDNIQSSPVSNEEIKQLMGQGAEAGIFHESEQQIVANVLHMDEKRADSIMTHRGEFFYIDIDDPFAENIQKIVNSSYSKILVVKENIDNILGVVNVTSILHLLHNNEEFNFEDHMDKPVYLPQSVTATQVLETFKRKRSESAIVVNEYGENIGIVTLNDIMTAIVGDLPNDEDAASPEVQQREDGSYLVDGLIGLDRLEHYLQIDNLPNDETVTTLAGLIMNAAGAIPEAGFKLSLETKDALLHIEVVDMDKNCIDKVIVKKELRQSIIIEELVS